MYSNIYKFLAKYDVFILLSSVWKYLLCVIKLEELSLDYVFIVS